MVLKFTYDTIFIFIIKPIICIMVTDGTWLQDRIIVYDLLFEEEYCYRINNISNLVVLSFIECNSVYFMKLAASAPESPLAVFYDIDEISCDTFKLPA